MECLYVFYLWEVLNHLTRTDPWFEWQFFGEFTIMI